MHYGHHKAKGQRTLGMQRSSNPPPLAGLFGESFRS